MGLLSTTREILEWSWNEYPTRKFPSSTDIWEFRELKYKIFKFGNSGILVWFSGLRRDGKWPVLNGRELNGIRSGWSWMLGTGYFPHFPGKNLELKKCRTPRKTTMLEENEALFCWRCILSDPPKLLNVNAKEIKNTHTLSFVHHYKSCTTCLEYNTLL